MIDFETALRVDGEGNRQGDVFEVAFEALEGGHFSPADVESRILVLLDGIDSRPFGNELFDAALLLMSWGDPKGFSLALGWLDDSERPVANIHRIRGTNRTWILVAEAVHLSFDMTLADEAADLRDRLISGLIEAAAEVPLPDDFGKMLDTAGVFKTAIDRVKGAVRRLLNADGAGFGTVRQAFHLLRSFPEEEDAWVRRAGDTGLLRAKYALPEVRQLAAIYARRSGEPTLHGLRQLVRDHRSRQPEYFDSQLAKRGTTSAPADEPWHVRTLGELRVSVALMRENLEHLAPRDDLFFVAGVHENGELRTRWYRVDDPSSDSIDDLGSGTSPLWSASRWLLRARDLINNPASEADAAAGQLRVAAAALDQVARFEADGDAIDVRARELLPEAHTATDTTRLAALCRSRAATLEEAETRDPELLMGAAFAEVMKVPTTTSHVGSAVLDHILAACMKASGFLREARVSAPTNATVLARSEQLEALTEEIMAAAQQLPALPPFDQVPIPVGMMSVPEGFEPPEVGSTAMSPGLGWHQVSASDERQLWRHDDGGVLELAVANHIVQTTTLHTGSHAFAVLAEEGHTLTAEAVEQLEAHLVEDRDPRHTLLPLDNQARWQFRPFIQGDAGNDRRLQTWVVDTWEPRRSALLLAVTTPQGLLLGHQILQGPAAVDQILRFATQMGGATPTPAPQAVEADAGPLEGLVSLLALGGTAFIGAVKPEPGDAARAFLPSLAPHVAKGIDAMWDDPEPPQFAPGSSGATYSATTKDLRERTGDAGRFSGGWKRLAEHLKPGTRWVGLQVDGGGRLDAFVWLDDHWAWFPKPWTMMPPE